MLTSATLRGTRINIVLGEYSDAEGYLAAFAEKHMTVSVPARLMMKTTVIHKTRQEFPVLRILLSDLGFDAPATASQAIEVGQRWGLFPCPAEAALALRLAVTTQVPGEWMTVIMDPLRARHSSCVYCVDAPGGALELRSVPVEVVLPANTPVVFGFARSHP